VTEIKQLGTNFKNRTGELAVCLDTGEVVGGYTTNNVRNTNPRGGQLKLSMVDKRTGI
jgi:hypothetical protein